MVGPTGDQSDAESEPGYASVTIDSINRSARLLDTTPSRRPRLATPPRATADDSPTVVASQAPREPLASSSPQERPIRTSKPPNVANELSFRSDSSRKLVPNPIPNDGEGSLNQLSGQQQPQKELSEQDIEQLYSQVNKRKDGSRNASAELPPKSPHSRTRGSQPPHSKRDSSRSKQLPLKERVMKTAEKTQYADLSFGARGTSHLDWQDGPDDVVRALEDGDREEEDDDTPEQAYTDDDFSASDEELQNCGYDHTGVRDSEVIRAKHHRRSATHPTHRTPLSGGASMTICQDGARRRHSASYRHRSSLPHVHTGEETSPVVHLQPVFLMQADGSVQHYYTAAPMHSQSSLHSPHAHRPALSWQGAPVYQPSVSPLTTAAVPSRLDPNTQGQPRFSVQQHQQQVANLVESKRVDQPPVPGSATQVSPAKATSASPVATAPQKTATQTLSPKATQRTSPTSPNPTLPSGETDVAGDPSPLQLLQAPHPLGDPLSPPSSKKPPSGKSPDLPHLSGRGDSALLSLSHSTASPLLKGESARVKRKMEFSDFNASWHGDTRVSRSRRPDMEPGDVDAAEEASLRDPTSSASPRSGTGPGLRVVPGQQDNKARVYRDLLCLVEQREAGLRKEVGTLHSANAELQEENSALKQLYEGLEQQWQPVEGGDSNRPSSGAVVVSNYTLILSVSVWRKLETLNSPSIHVLHVYVCGEGGGV